MVDSPTDFAPAADFLPALLDLLPTGVVGYTPITDAAGEVVDFAFAYLNPAAQRMLGLPARPPATFSQQFPATLTNGSFVFHRDTYLGGGPCHFEVNYQADGYDNYFQVEARRLGDKLLVVFTDTASQSRTTVEEALRESQAREVAARAEVEAQQATLRHTFEQAPVAITIFEGPAHRISFANAEAALFWGRPLAQVVGRNHFEALPDMVGQGFEAMFADVYHTGKSYHLREQLVQIDRIGTGELVPGYFNIVYQPQRDAQERITGIIASATEVTDQVLARQQVQTLNGELETRVAQRTAETQAALHDAQNQREQLREQQHLLGQILSQVPASVATLTGPEHRFTYFNEPYRVLSADRAVLGHTMAEVFPEVVDQGFIGLLDQVYAIGQPFVGTDTPAQLHDPATGQLTQHYFDFIFQPLRDGLGYIQGILAFIVDTTDKVLTRRQAEALQAAVLAATQRQAQHRQDLYQVFEQTPAAIVLLREPDHRIDYFNPAFEALFPPEEWTGRLHGHTLAEVYPRIKMAGLVDLLDRVFDTGEPQVVIEMPLAELQPGSPRYVTFAYQAYREQNRIVGVAAFVYEVTEQVLARQERESRQQDLQRIFEQAPAAIAILRGPNLVIELANAAVGAIWGRSPAQVLGRPYFEALPDTAGQGFEAILAGVLQTGQSFAITEAPVQFARAHTGLPALGYVNFVFQPLYDKQAQVSGLIAIGIEVTDQVLARQQVQILNEEMQATNQELHDANARLSRTNADLDTFVYSASHDLKSPITNIEGLLLALRQQLPAEVLQTALVPRLLEMMDGAVTRFQQTLDHLTDVSRLQQVLADQPAEAVDLPALVEAVRLDILPELTAAGATLTLDVADCPVLRFSAKNLRSILYNLLSNAVKYHDPARPPLVHLSCRPAAAGQTVLEVQDNGLGLTEAQQSELFRLFRRLHSHVSGSGVGLYMVKKMVDNAGGTLVVRSQPGIGSTFTITLPAASPPQL